MAANAKVTGKVEYRAGDGPMIAIPEGPVEIRESADSVVICWGEGNSAQSAAIPLSEYQRYVADGLISDGV